jgi:hypothetical protein
MPLGKPNRFVHKNFTPLVFALLLTLTKKRPYNNVSCVAYGLQTN